MLNKIVICGRLTDDPKIRDAETYKLARFKIACNRDYQAGRDQPTDFINCSAFGSTADFVYNNFYKGDLIMIVGRLQIDEDREAKRSYASIKVEQAYFGGTKKGDDEPKRSKKASSSKNVDESQSRFQELNGMDESEMPF